jgi:hypothetical protein
VNYDKRPEISNSNRYYFAISQIVAIQILLEKENKKIELQQIIDNEEVRLKATILENYFITWNIVFIIRHS